MSEDLQQQKFQRMTTAPVERLVCSLAVPSVIGMLISSFYNMVDTFYIGKISTQATGAIGIVFSYMSLLQAVSFFFGQGSGNYISRQLGGQRIKEAEKMAATGFFTALFLGVLFVVLGLLFMDPFLIFLGATDTILPEARRYFQFILLATPFIMESFILNNLLRFQGNAKLGTIGISVGAVLNIVLDPILIFHCQMGIAGAAIATAASQLVSFLILLFECGRGGGIVIRWRNFSPKWRLYREIVAGGLPSLGRQGLASVAAVCLNHAVKPFGDAAIAAFSVVNRVTMMTNAAIIGFDQGFQLVCGFNYGAGLYDRVKKGFWFCVKVATAALLILGVLVFGLAVPIVTVFRKDDLELIVIAVKALRCQAVTLPLVGWIVVVNMFLQNTRRTARATIVAAARQGLVFIPVLFLAAAVSGLLGIQLAQPISDVLTFLLAIPLGVSALREMRETEPESEMKHAIQPAEAGEDP